jgi:hypothetical protein
MVVVRSILVLGVWSKWIQTSLQACLGPRSRSIWRLMGDITNDAIVGGLRRAIDMRREYDVLLLVLSKCTLRYSNLLPHTIDQARFRSSAPDNASCTETPLGNQIFWRCDRARARAEKVARAIPGTVRVRTKILEGFFRGLCRIWVLVSYGLRSTEGPHGRESVKTQSGGPSSTPCILLALRKPDHASLTAT